MWHYKILKSEREKIHALEERKILKRYVVDGNHCIEIIHDRYSAAVKRERDFRKDAEQKKIQLLKDQEDLQRKRLENDRNIAEKEAIHEKLLREKWQKFNKRLTRFVVSFILLAILIMFVLVYAINSSYDTILQFTQNEEKTVLKYIELDQGTYSSFVQANEFQNKINSFNEYLFPLSKLKELKDAVDTLLVKAFNKKPFFYSKIDLENLIQIANSEERIFVDAGLVYVNKEDTLFIFDYIKGKKDTIMLSTPIREQKISLSYISKDTINENSQVDYGTVSTNSNRYDFSPNYFVLRTGDSLYFFKISKSPTLVNSWKLIYPQSGFHLPLAIKISLDEKKYYFTLWLASRRSQQFKK